MLYEVITRAQPAAHHVEHHEYPGMAEVAVVVHGHPAHVHARLSGPQRDEFGGFPRKGVVIV